MILAAYDGRSQAFNLTLGANFFVKVDNDLITDVGTTCHSKKFVSLHVKSKKLCGSSIHKYFYSI